MQSAWGRCGLGRRGFLVIKEWVPQKNVASITSQPYSTLYHFPNRKTKTEIDMQPYENWISSFEDFPASEIKPRIKFIVIF